MDILKTTSIDKSQINAIISGVSTGLIFIAAIINVYYSRKNIKTSKSVDVVTSARMKWLDLIREDFSELFSEMLILANRGKQAINLNQHMEQLLIMNSSNTQSEYYKKIEEIRDEIKTEIHNPQRKKDILKKSFMLILRLNPKEDEKIINNLKKINEIVQKNSYEQNELVECLSIVDLLIVDSQKILKNEWEKIKCESFHKNK